MDLMIYGMHTKKYCMTFKIVLDTHEYAEALREPRVVVVFAEFILEILLYKLLHVRLNLLAGSGLELFLVAARSLLMLWFPESYCHESHQPPASRTIPG